MATSTCGNANSNQEPHGLRVEDAVAGPREVAQRGRDPRRRVADDAGRCAQAGIDRPPDRAAARPRRDDRPGQHEVHPPDQRRVDARLDRPRRRLRHERAGDGGHRPERPPGDAADGIRADRREDAEPGERRPGRPVPSPRDEDDDGRDGREEEDAGHVAQRRRLPFGDPLGDLRVDRQADGVAPHERAEGRQAGGGGSSPGRPAGPGGHRAPDRAGPRARPGRARPGPRKKLPWMFAQTTTRTGTSQSRPGCARRSVDEQEGDREDRHARAAGAAARARPPRP